MPNLNVNILGREGNTRAAVTGQGELVVSVGSIASTTGLATELTLSQILTTLQDFTEYEAKFIIDSTNEVFLEVRVWRPEDQTWGPITYYRPGETTPAAPPPVAPLKYGDPNSLLTLILAELQKLNGTTIAGQALMADSMSVVIASDQVVPVSGTLTTTPSGTQDVNIISTIALPVTDNGGSLTVDATNLDIRDLAFATDKVDVSGSTVTVQDGGGSLTVDGTVNVGNFPASIEISNDSGNPLPVNGTVAATQSGTWNIGSVTGPVALPTGAATETTLNSALTKLTSIEGKLTPIAVTPGYLRATGSGSIGVAAYSVAVANVGAANGTLLGTTIAPGESLSFDAGGNNNTFAAGTFTYNGTGTTLVITYSY